MDVDHTVWVQTKGTKNGVNTPDAADADEIVDDNADYADGTDNDDADADAYDDDDDSNADADDDDADADADDDDAHWGETAADSHLRVART